MTKNLSITAMDHIVLNVRDVEASLRFYGEVLGLKQERVEEYRAGKVTFPSVRISDSCLIDLVQDDGQAAGAARTNLAHYCLVAQEIDLEALAADLRGQGVEVLRGPVPRWGARGDASSVYFLDPDGNEIEVRCY